MYRQHPGHGMSEIFTDICTDHDESQLAQESDSDPVPVRVQREIEFAVSLLEKDIHDKQDTLIGLKEQLKEVKAINYEMYQKKQNSEEDGKESDVKNRQDGKTSQTAAAMKPPEPSIAGPLVSMVTTNDIVTVS
ncbi:unnamed protein product [Ranitomeya imitator]|uniref:Uncharacterized protein n=1 Tax=Ranitomeya imitator TaxID=111125 RepID=A0ABN9MC25_9NEOB|nr:unnamed protein product [Ranitomeya imitator]